MILSNLEAVLLSHGSLRDCVVRERTDSSGRVETIAYVVFDGPLSSQRLDDHIRASAFGLEPPDVYAPVVAIPLDDEGRVDQGALDAVAIVDDWLVAQWQTELAQVPGVEDAVVVLEEHPPITESLHLANLLPGWERQLDSALAPSTSEDALNPVLRESECCPAEAFGGELMLDADTPNTLGASLFRAAERYADGAIGYLQAGGLSSTETYAELKSRAQKIGAGLRNAGAKPGEPVVMQLAETADFIGVFWGCVAAGAIPVPVAVPASYREDAGAIEKLLNAWKLLNRGLVIANRAGAAQLNEIATERQLEGFRTLAIEDLCAFEDDDFWHAPDPEDVALMMLTSGTTGAPKAVMLSHRNLVGRSVATQLLNELSSKDVSLNWMPMDHVAGLVYFHLRDVFLGCRQLHAPIDLVLQQPTRWLDWLEEYRVTVTFAPNFAYALVNDRADELAARKWELGSVRYFMNAGEAIVAATARRFLELLEPHGLARTAMLPAWGMSETSSAVTFGKTFTRDSTADDDPFVEVGEPLPGFAMRIVDGDGRPVFGETVGNLEVRGVSVTAGYYRNPEANAESFTVDGWFRTGDLAFLLNGSLTVTGRTKDVIIINGVNYYSHEIEKVVDDLDGVSATFSAACAVRDRGAETDQLAIFFHSAITNNWGLARLLEEIRQTVVSRIGILPRYLIPVAMDAIPRTGIGKIQKPLLRKQFEAGQFEQHLQGVERLVAGSNTLPPWFYRPVWVRREAISRPSADIDAGGHCLVLHDSSELAEKLRSELQKRGRDVVAVRPGPGFMQLGSLEYQIDPQDPHDFVRVLENAAAAGAPIRSVVNLWSHQISDPGQSRLERAKRRGADSVLHLIRALDSVHGDDTRCALLAVTSRIYSIVDGEEPSIAHAELPALMRTLSQELTWLESRALDLSGEDMGVEAERIVDELEALPVDAEVAYRHDHRWVRRLEALSEAEFATSVSPFRRHGVYLITGGLGGIGGQIARYLLSEFEARLLLVGRRQLPAVGLASRGNSADHERLKLLEDLDDLPGEIQYHSVDICDAEALSNAVMAAEERWSASLSGVVHLAGSFRERRLLDESVDSFTEATRAKMLGTERLCELVRARQGATFVAFSSVNGFFGGYGAGAYAAANAYLDAAVQELALTEGIDAYCFAWSLWDEVGMSRGYELKAAAQHRGFRIISPAKGLQSFLGALNTGQRHLLIGLDGENASIRPLIVPARPSRQQLVAYVSPQGAASTITAPRLLDRFNTETCCEIRPVSAIPRAASGDLDLAALAGGEGPGGQDRVAPASDLERQIAMVWKELLGLEEIGVNETFFEIGADSISMSQARLQIQKVAEADVALATLYEYPTIHKLAVHFSGAGASPAPEIEDSERRGSERRERMKRRTRRTGIGQKTTRIQPRSNQESAGDQDD